MFKRERTGNGSKKIREIWRNNILNVSLSIGDEYSSGQYRLKDCGDEYSSAQYQLKNCGDEYSSG
jgi:hypothetical protein